MRDTSTFNLWHEQYRGGQIWRNPAVASGLGYDPEQSSGGGFADGNEASPVHDRRHGGLAVPNSRR